MTTPPLENFDPPENWESLKGYSPKVEWIPNPCHNLRGNEGYVAETTTGIGVRTEDLVKQYNLLVDILTSYITKKV